MCHVKLFTFAVLIILPFIHCHTVYSQDSININLDHIKLNIPPTYIRPHDLNLSSDFYKIDLPNEYNTLFSLPSFGNTKKMFDKKGIQVSYTPNKFTNDFIGLGGSELFNNLLTIQYQNRFFLNTNFSLEKRDFLTNSNFSDFRVGLKTSFEYEINNNHSVYIYWQKTKPLNKPKIEYEPFEDLSKTLFMNNEIGIGIKTQLKSIKTNIGINAEYNSEVHKNPKINTMNTKISLEF